MTPTDQLRLASVLARVEKGVRTKGMAPGEDFRPGLRRNDVRRLGQSLPFPLPEELVTLYAWHDGMTPGGQLLPGLTFKSLEEALDDYSWHLARNREGQPYPDGVPTGVDGRVLEWPDYLRPWGPDWFPIFRSGYCDHFVRCGAVDAGALWYWCAQFGDLGWQADSLAELMEWLARVYEEGAYYHDHYYGAAIDRVKSSAILRSLERGHVDVTHLVETLRSDDPLQRIKARGRLASRQYPEAVDLLLPYLQGDGHWLAGAAAEVLSGSERPDVVAALIKAAAWWEIERHPQGNPVLHTIFRGRDQQVTVLGEQLTAAGDEEVRVAAALCLGALGDVRAIPALYTAKSDPSPAVRVAAAEALGRLQKPRSQGNC